MKRFISILLSLIVALLTCLTASASGLYSKNDIATPYYEIAINAYSSLSFSGKTASCASDVNGEFIVTEIKIEQTLQKKGALWSWNDVPNASWTTIVKGTYGKVTKTKANLSSGTYRLETICTLTAKDGTTETITVYSNEKTIS